MRKEATNTFTDGLNMDLNPNNTPDTVLTDNVNGTIITYNGNEFLLQNDQGNYKLENCKLKPNYIPVGVQEYADTLYIVSYNPLDKHVEVGSYPAPKTIQDSSRSGENKEVNSVLSNPETLYTELIKHQKYELFYNGDRDNDDYKLFPGDQYKLDITDNSSNYKYEDIQYIVIDDNQKIWDVSKEINNPGEPDSNGFYYVGWQIPGWLGAQYKIANFDEFDVNVPYVYKPSIDTGEPFCLEARINFQIKVSDNIFLKNWNNGDRDLYIKYTISIVNDGGEVITHPNYSGKKEKIEKSIDWYNGTKILYSGFKIDKDSTVQITSDSIIKIDAVPCIEDNGKIIEYNNFKTEISIPLDTIGNLSDIELGKDTFNWIVSHDDNSYYGDSVYLNLGISGPLTISNDVILCYKILDINNNEILGYTETVNHWQPGVTGLSLKFNDKFVQEDIYRIQFAFKEIESDVYYGQDDWNFLFIPSIVFEDFFNNSITKFESIAFKDWAQKFENYINYDATFDNVSIDQSSKRIYDSVSGDSVFYDKMIKASENDDPSFLFRAEEPGEISIKKGYEYDAIGDFDYAYSGLRGPLWDGLVSSLLERSETNSNFGIKQISKGSNQPVSIRNYQELLINSYSGSYEALYSENIDFKSILKDVTASDITIVSAKTYDIDAWGQPSIATYKGVFGEALDVIQNNQAPLKNTITGILSLRLSFIVSKITGSEKSTIILDNNTQKYISDRVIGATPFIIAIWDNSKRGIGISVDGQIKYSENNDGCLFVMLLAIQTSNNVYIVDPANDGINTNTYRFKGELEVDESEWTGSDSDDFYTAFSKAAENGLRKNETFIKWIDTCMAEFKNKYGNIYYNAIDDELVNGRIYTPIITNNPSNWNNPEINITISASQQGWNYKGIDMLNINSRAAYKDTLLSGPNPNIASEVIVSTQTNLSDNNIGDWPWSDDGKYIGFNTLIDKLKSLNMIDISKFTIYADMLQSIYSKTKRSVGVAYYADSSLIGGLNKINDFINSFNAIGITAGAEDVYITILTKAGDSERSSSTRISIGNTDVDFGLINGK